MQVYELIVTGRSVQPNSDDTTLVRTSRGIDQVHVLFDNAEWLDFAVTATFAQGDGDSEVKVTQSITPSAIEGFGYVAEATCLVPWEVIQEDGEIRVTFDGTDGEGGHIVTAAGAPLSVVPCGDTPDGDVPSDAPSESQWQQAYASAMQAASEALSAAAACAAAIEEMSHYTVPVATTSRLGGVIPDGTTITVDEDGVISGNGGYELTPATDSDLGGVMVDDETIEADEEGVISLERSLLSALTNLRILASLAFDSTFDQDGYVSDATVKDSALPIASTTKYGAVMPDGTSVTASSGVLSAPKLCWHGTCSTAAATTAKAVTCAGFALRDGAVVAVTFTTASTAAAPTMNVNSTGALSMYVNNAAASSTNELTWEAGETLTFMYDGSRYRLLARDKASGSGAAVTSGTLYL